MQVTLTVDKEGLVGDVQLSSHATDGRRVHREPHQGLEVPSVVGDEDVKITLVFQSG
ncbi:MAG TPA: hypothetical protein VMJ10_32260 [Kofleriaceae bacterium]|nr:hypothetical protein [Kofleriaceae bacterium]